MSSVDITAALPLEYSGLDPLFNSFFKLCICDVLTIDESGAQSGVYRYGSHAVATVDIMGVIVKKDVRDKLIIYAVDDGTGVISCTCWKAPYGDQRLEALPRLAESVRARSLCAKLAEMQKCRQGVAEGFDLGTLVRVRGNVTSYNGQREIKASQFGRCSAVDVDFFATRALRE